MKADDALDRVLPSDDPLDRSDFSPIAFINQKFPSERSMEGLEPYVARVNGQISQLDEEVSRAVQEQAEAGERAARDLAEAKGAIHELHTKIKDVKSKAEQSELMVQEICRDIKQLDYAKRHLQTTITALKRLHMLVTAVDQLQMMASEKHYREAANLLDAVSQLLTHFEPYAEIARIRELRETVEHIKAELTEEILRAFNRIGAVAGSVADPEAYDDRGAGAGEFATLSEACLVVDALGPESAQRQIDAVVSKHMEGYRKMPEFKSGGDAASLDQIDRRFSWFRRMLKEVEARFGSVFPEHWKVSHRLCVDFLKLTHSQLRDVLSSGGSEVENVTILLKALQKSLMFEKDMKMRFEGEVDDVGNDLDENGNYVDPGSAEGIRRRYNRERAVNTRLDGGSAVDAVAENLGRDGRGSSNGAHSGPVPTPLPKIIGLLSSVFDPFMGPYIGKERKNMEDMMQKYIQEEQVGQDGALPVYTSSVQMFGYIKGSVKRCTALTAGQTFFDLHKEFKACLSQYGTILKQKLGAGGGRPLPDNFEKDVCYVVNTAAYCAETIPQLEESIKSKIDDRYKESVDLNHEQESFYDVIAAAIRTLVAALQSQVESAFKTMTGINWGTLEMVGEESPYVRDINAAVLKYVPNCRAILSSLYFRNFCDKFAAAFCPAYLQLIQKQRRISEEGTQQLLLDVYNLKKMMQELPRIGREPDDVDVNVPMSYRKFIEKHMSKIEKVLKLVATPVGMLVEHFRMMWPEGGTKELQIVMALKGMKKNEQITVLETFGGSAATESGGSGLALGGRQAQDGGSLMDDVSQGKGDDLKARAMKGMKTVKGAMDDFQGTMKTAFTK